MHQLTTITRTSTGRLPESLALLSAPIIGDKDSPDTDPLGHVEGVVMDEAGHVAFFVARVAQRGRLTGKRVLVPLAGLRSEETTHTYGSRLILRTSWTQDQFLAQPDFTDDHQLPRNRTDGTPPVEGRWMPAVPNVIPPGTGVNRSKALRLGTKWGLPMAIVGAIVGGLVGYVAGSLFAAVTTAIFFGLAAGIAGAIAGATRDSAVDAGEIHAMNPVTSGPSATVEENVATAGMPHLRMLETTLQDKGLYNQGLLKATSVLPTLQRVRTTEKVNTPSILEASKPLRT